MDLLIRLNVRLLRLPLIKLKLFSSTFAHKPLLLCWARKIHLEESNGGLEKLL
jgi:hypothetical protein